MKGLDAVDFSPGGLGYIETVSWPSALDIAWSKLPTSAKLPFVGISREAFNAKLTSAARGYEVYKSTDGPPGRAVSDDAILSGVTDPTERSMLSEMLSNLHADGYYIASQIQTSIPSVPRTTTSPPSFWSSLVPNFNAYQTIVGTPKTGDINSLIQQRLNAQKNADSKARLPYIIGIGGLIFVISIALLASSGPSSGPKES